jgi:hypothetical protein
MECFVVRGEWDIHNSVVILRTEDMNTGHDEELSWFTCSKCHKDFMAGEMVCRVPETDGNLVREWALLHPLCIANIMIEQAALQIEESVRV